jgi:hypothetical protein
VECYRLREVPVSESPPKRGGYSAFGNNRTTSGLDDGERFMYDAWMATCMDNPELRRLGCGATYGGESQHCVARAEWSDQPDGMVHLTGPLSIIESLWTLGAKEARAAGEDCGPADNPCKLIANPADYPDKFVLKDNRRVSGPPMSEEIVQRMRGSASTQD